MPIHDFSYRHWQGQRSTRPPWLILGLSQFTLIVRRRWVRLLLLVSAGFFLVYVFMIYVETVPEDSVLSFLAGMDVLSLNANTLRIYLAQQRLIHYLLCLAAGVELIALDRRHKALQIYLARPLRVPEYLLGKSLPLLALLSLTTWIPGILLVVLKTLATANLTWLSDEPWLPLAILGYSICLIVPLTLLTLAVSSISSSPRLAAGQFVAVLVLSILLSEILAGLTRNHTWRLFSLKANLDQVSSWVFAHRLPHDFSPSLALVALALISVGSAILLKRRVRAVDVVGGS